MKYILPLLVFLFIANLVVAKDVQIVTEHFPPYQMVEKGEVVDGLGLEIMQALLFELDYNYPIVPMPWARAYEIALHEENVLIFSITRTVERESLFKWVGSINGVGDYLWSLATRDDIRIDNLDDAKKYKIAVPRNDCQQQLLEQHGFKENVNLVTVSRWEQAIRMLYSGRVDMIMGSNSALVYRLKTLGLDYDLLQQTYEVGQMWGDLSIAFSSATDDVVVEEFRTAYQSLKNKGIYKEIFQKWEKLIS